MLCNYILIANIYKTALDCLAFSLYPSILHAIFFWYDWAATCWKSCKEVFSYMEIVLVEQTINVKFILSDVNL